jgi:CheY-like chemotaxis protein/DNA-directed RNA polymerase subunit RPC12/RpoP
MQKKCTNCGKTLNIPDEKIPEGKTVSLTCPSCREKMKIFKEKNNENDSGFDFEESASDIPDFASDEEENTESSDDIENGESELTEGWTDSDQAGDPFDFIEEEGLSAMVCTGDEQVRAHVSEVLEYMEYSVFSPKDNHEALRELRMRGDFTLIIADEKFSCEDISGNAVVRYIKRLPMRGRREIYAVLISDTRRTLDRKDAFAHSMNMIINKGHISKFEDFLKKGFAENENFYKNFKETLKKGLKF